MWRGHCDDHWRPVKLISMKNNNDLLRVICAYTAFGLLPLYWKELSGIPAAVVLAHRVFWSLIFLGLLVIYRGDLKVCLKQFLSYRHLLGVLISSMLITINWLTYVWAMSHDRIVESGLGYFICPIFSIALGGLVFRERIAGLQRLAIGLVIFGVLVKVFAHNSIPWIALLLAASFACYVTVRKCLAADPIRTLFQEVVVALPLILLSIHIWFPGHAALALAHSSNVLLILSGPITVIPLLWLARGLQRVPLQVSAMAQYIAPSLTVIIGIWSGEQLTSADWLALCIIWCGIACYLIAGLRIGSYTPTIQISRLARNRLT